MAEEQHATLIIHDESLRDGNVEMQSRFAKRAIIIETRARHNDDDDDGDISMSYLNRGEYLLFRAWE